MPWCVCAASADEWHLIAVAFGGGRDWPVQRAEHCCSKPPRRCVRGGNLSAQPRCPLSGTVLVGESPLRPLRALPPLSPLLGVRLARRITTDVADQLVVAHEVIRASGERGELGEKAVSVEAEEGLEFSPKYPAIGQPYLPEQRTDELQHKIEVVLVGPDEHKELTLEPG